MPHELKDWLKETPGEVELASLCRNAAILTKICRAIGYEFRGAEPMVRDLGELIDQGHTVLVEQEDGAWILPEEI